MDPHWVRPLLHLASKCPAVLDRVSRHLRSIEFRDWYTEAFPVILPQLSRLESLEYSGTISPSQLSTLPTGLTELHVWVGLKGASFEDFSASLLRLTALEELDLGLKFDVDRTVGGSLPRLRRLECRGRPPRDLGTFAPNLEALEAELESEDLEQLPITLTKLRFGGSRDLEASVLPLARLTGLKDLGLPSCFEFSHLFELFGSLKALSRLTMEEGSTEDLTELVEALRSSPEGMGLCLPAAQFEWIESDSSDVEYVFRRLLEMDQYQAMYEYRPWAALTRLTWLELAVNCGWNDAYWIQPLSQLPSLRDLEIQLRQRVPAGFDALTQCTGLKLEEIESAANLSCLQHLTRLRECKLENSSVKCLAALPDCLTNLDFWYIRKSPHLPLGAALRHLTALEDLRLHWPEGEDRVCDLSPLRRLTSLQLDSVPCRLIRLGPLPCLRSLSMSDCEGMDDSFLQQVGGLLGLKDLWLSRNCCIPTEGILDALTRLSLLEKLSLPNDFPHSSASIRRLMRHLPLLSTSCILSWIASAERLQQARRRTSTAPS